MKVIRANHLGMCFGVRDAIALAEDQAARAPLTILGDLVHNETVLAELRQRGVRFAQTPEQAGTRELMITAHGASQKTIQEARSLGFNVSEATCPLVHFAHRSVLRLDAEGYHPVIIGQRNHVEVRGLIGDLAVYDVVLTLDDVAQMSARERFGVISQTTQPVERVRQLVAAIRARFPQAEVKHVDTVCLPTKQRQKAAAQLAGASDVVIVIGGAHSNNTRELVASCGALCARVHHVQTAQDLKLEWFDAHDTVGLTAGTSTPDSIIDAVEAALRAMYPEANDTLEIEHAAEAILISREAA